MAYSFFLALRYLRVHRGHTFLSVITLISVAGVAVGAAALVIALSLMAGFEADVRDRIHSGSAHLTVTSRFEDTFGDVETLLAAVLSVKGVEAAGPVLYSPAMITADGNGSTPQYIQLYGVDPWRHTAVVLGKDPEPTAFEALANSSAGRRPGMVLGEQLARTLGVTTGDEVRVLVPRVGLTPWGVAPQSQLFEMVGTYRSRHFQEDSQRAYIQVPAAQRLLRAPEQATWAEVRLQEIDDLPVMKERLQEALFPEWIVVDLIEQNKDLLRALNTERILLFLAIGLIVVVAALNIVSTLILMVNDKIRDIGTLTALGARPTGVAAVFVLQGLVIGILGTISGLILGTAISYWLHAGEVIQLNPDVYYLSFVPFQTRPIDLVWIGVAALAVSLLATIYPASKAARLRPVEALRHD
ncbi:MAG: ABC transporter permease [Acidobacteriota bacterium]|nr:ABC transporter permease [Acidobacteriota bacterium]MDH3784570.1 ABC transporter permease [Acidobacteriota bacterium]